MLLPEEQEKIFSSLLKRKQNAFCAECGSKSPCWASLAFGVFVCLNCSGAHRALGPSVTRVKSIRLDTWNREWLDFMQIGNTNINLYYEHLLSDDRNAKPNESSSIDSLIKFVHDKYVRKIYANPNQSMNPLQKSKTNKANKTEVTTNNNNQPINCQKNEAPKTGKLQKAATVNYPVHSKSVNKAGVTDFSFFDEIMTVKKTPQVPKSPKPQAKQGNLISFDEEKPKGTPRSNAFEDFQFSVGLQKPKEQKYNKQQFMSMGGIKPNKQKCEANFDLFPSADKQAKKTDNLISFEGQRSQKPMHTMYNDYGVSSQQIHPNHQQAHNKNHFATISGDYHVKQQIFVLSTQKAKMKCQKPTIHAFGFQSSWLATEGFPVAPQMNQRLTKIGNTNITLESNINLSKLGGQNNSKKESPSISSWVDEWK